MMQAWVALMKGNDMSYQLRYFRMKNKNGIYMIIMKMT